MTDKYRILGADIIEGPLEAGLFIATANSPTMAARISQLLNWSSSPRFKPVMDALFERARQDEKWGEQNHDPITWSAILTEECGEFAEAALHQRFGGPAAQGLRTEAIQCAAVALQIVECIDRNAAPPASSASN